MMMMMMIFISITNMIYVVKKKKC